MRWGVGGWWFEVGPVWRSNRDRENLIPKDYYAATLATCCRQPETGWEEIQTGYHSRTEDKGHHPTWPQWEQAQAAGLPHRH